MSTRINNSTINKIYQPRLSFKSPSEKRKMSTILTYVNKQLDSKYLEESNKIINTKDFSSLKPPSPVSSKIKVKHSIIKPKLKAKPSITRNDHSYFLPQSCRMNKNNKSTRNMSLALSNENNELSLLREENCKLKEEIKVYKMRIHSLEKSALLLLAESIPNSFSKCPQPIPQIQRFCN